jgi:hypothetical protein
MPQGVDAMRARHHRGVATPDESTDALIALRRWESFGAKWRVLDRGLNGLTISLCRCDSDEEVDRIISNDARLIAYIHDRPASD